MKTLTRQWALAAAIALCAGSAAAGVSVTYVQPENYSDLAFSPYDRDALIKQFDAYFATLGKRVAPGQELKLEVFDIDLAGRTRPTRHGTELRVLKGGADWPSMHLRYRLEDQGKLVQSGDETIKDMNYLNRFNHYPQDDTLRYEKQMIDDWFRDKIAAAKPAA
jgi:hypothetical protein